MFFCGSDGGVTVVVVDIYVRWCMYTVYVISTVHGDAGVVMVDAASFHRSA